MTQSGHDELIEKPSTTVQPAEPLGSNFVAAVHVLLAYLTPRSHRLLCHSGRRGVIPLIGFALSIYRSLDIRRLIRSERSTPGE